MRLILPLWFACGCIAAQPGAVAPSFDVASVKRLPAGAPRRPAAREITPSSLTLGNFTLGNCLQLAYKFEHYQVIGPEWRDRPTDVVYEIVAKTASPVSEAQILLMLQTLLKERLGLAFHRETKDLPIYALVVARGGPKFHKSETEGDPAVKSVGIQATRFERFSMAHLAEAMLDPPFTSRHTVDETGLTGVFDFTIDLVPYLLDPNGKPILDGRGALDMEAAYIQALPAQLGLRLEKRTAPLEVMVIDHVEKDPTAN